MARLAVRVVVLSCGLCLLCSGAAEAQRRSNRGAARQIARRLQREIQEIQKNLPAAQEELGQATKALTQAQVQHRQAQAEIEQARRTVNERVAPKVGLPAAQAESERTRKVYDKASSDFFREHQRDEDFQRLRRNQQAADDALNAFRKEKSADAGERKDKLAELTKAAHHARDAYQSRIDRDPAVKPAHDQWMQAEAKLAEVRRKLSQEAKHDPELKAAESMFKQAKTSLEQAQAAATIAAAKVAFMQERIATNLALLGN